MALSAVATYYDPGVYTEEVLIPSGGNIPAQPFAVCLIGVGSKNKRIINEQVVKGGVSKEAITPLTSAPHTATLANRAVRDLSTMQLYKTLNSLESAVDDVYLSIGRPYVQGSVTGTVNLSTTNAFGLELDGIRPITLVMHDVVSYIAGSCTFTLSSGVVTLVRTSATFIADGIRPGHVLTVALSEDATNNGTYTVLTVPSATTVTLAPLTATGVTTVAAPDTTATLAFSGTGFVGREVHVLYDFTTFAAATMTELAAATNQGLAASTDLGYGSAYANAASVSTSALRITSQLYNADGTSKAASDVRVSSAIASDAATAIFGASVAGTRDAVTSVTISPTVWSASATWTLTYAALVDDTDSLAQTTNIQRISRVGSSPGGTDFTEFADFQLTSNAIDWTPDTAAQLVGIAGLDGSAPAKTFNISTNDLIKLQVDGLTGSITGSAELVLDLNGMVNPPLGYADPSSAAAATVTELVANINALLAAELGPRYRAAASSTTVDGTNRVTITSQVEGKATSTVQAKHATSLSATSLLFGGEVTKLGTGKRPAAGSTYYVTYDYTRPTGEYALPYRHFRTEDALAQVGKPSASVAGYNPLAIAVQIAFENNAQIVYTIQVEDSSEGNPTRAEVLECLDGAKTLSGTTEIVVVGEPGTRVDVTVDMMDHLEQECSPFEKHYRRIFCGMAAGTAIGDKNSDASYIQRAARTLQASNAESPARGRMFLLAPPRQAGVTKLITLDDGVKVRATLDSTYFGVAMAARRTALPLACDTLTNSVPGVTGFDTDNITAGEVWKPAERKLLAGNGVCVVTFDAGRFIFKDAMTTEGGGGNDDKFKVDSTSYQKDIITNKVNQALDANIVGIVPYDLPSFVLDIKLVIQGVLASEIGRTIGPFLVKETGEIRSIDLRTDIIVRQATGSRTTFQFNYWYNLRYPALRLLGSYSVDAPFFAAQA